MTYKTARGTPYRIVREMWSAYGDFCGLLVEVYPGQQAASFIATLRPEDGPPDYIPVNRPAVVEVKPAAQPWVAPVRPKAEPQAQRHETPKDLGEEFILD